MSCVLLSAGVPQAQDFVMKRAGPRTKPVTRNPSVSSPHTDLFASAPEIDRNAKTIGLISCWLWLRLSLARRKPCIPLATGINFLPAVTVLGNASGCTPAFRTDRVKVRGRPLQVRFWFRAYRVYGVYHRVNYRVYYKVY